MLSLEEKQALLVKKWVLLHKTISPSKKKLEAKPDGTLEYDKIEESKAPEKIETPFQKLTRSIWEASGRDLKTLVPEGVKNQSWYLLNLKGALEWHGNIAIGADRYFDGWFNVVPPIGVMISYFGPGAIDRAREMAKHIEAHYR